MFSLSYFAQMAYAWIEMEALLRILAVERITLV